MTMQVTLCEQLTSYLTKFKPATRNSTASTSAAAVDIPGMQVFKKKGMQVALDTVDWLTSWCQVLIYATVAPVVHGTDTCLGLALAFG